MSRSHALKEPSRGFSIHPILSPTLPRNNLPYLFLYLHYAVYTDCRISARTLLGHRCSVHRKWFAKVIFCLDLFASLYFERFFAIDIYKNRLFISAAPTSEETDFAPTQTSLWKRRSEPVEWRELLWEFYYLSQHTLKCICLPFHIQCCFFADAVSATGTALRLD